MSALAAYKQNMGARLAKQRQAVDSMFEGLVLLSSAATGGYVAAQKADFAGVPTDAALGLALAVGGLSMKHRKVACIGLGMLAGYAGRWGYDLGMEHPVLSLAAL